ncbi:hypothetical protein B5S28_g3232 [[Candida] boidinii]|uniref:Unnamed protein product n=1 Tax=Candida boidinii TaxID=5477 RepID=A0ACB5TYN7_CANBO|nr:hypothetical protein B5S28_g3232 [[Candida] boidinii]OWB63535.1 hypothetical protein B5S29_g4520 [[Candida] boidinii]OWB75460.1 hypothetical protein B5S31_g5362 [[Candida] boidinii]OWB79300.1 hypothetical protein B5S32_g3516 [[Candida] boidinii]GME98020.1 unnamed protein product [[Candida] boidinii]
MSNRFGQIRTQIISVEKQLETQLSHYSKFTTGTTSEPMDDEINTEESIKQLLNEKQNLINQLNKIIELESESISTSKLTQFQRNKEILNENYKDFNRIKESIQQERNKLNLLFSVRNDINEHRKRTEQNLGVSIGEDDNMYYDQEANRVNNMNSFADRLLQQVWETGQEVTRQNATLNNVSIRLQRSLSTIPGLNVLLSKINTRRRRDTIIIASVIVICLILLWFAF